MGVVLCNFLRRSAEVMFRYKSTINRSCDVALKTYKDADSDFMEHAVGRAGTLG